MQPRAAVASLHDKILSSICDMGSLVPTLHCEGARHTGVLTPQWEAGSKGLSLPKPPCLHL